MVITMPRDVIRSERPREPILPDGKLVPGGFDGKWELSSHAVKVDAIGTGAWLGFGSNDLADFEFKTGLTAVSGGNASIFFRQQGQNYYQFDLKCELQAAVVSRTTAEGAIVISAVNFELFPGREYDIEIAARGESITTYIDGRLINQVRDATFPRGSLCLTAWQSRTQFSHPRLRVY
jgi:hypothetical protein